MKQKIIVQGIIQNKDKVLLLHRCQGSPDIIGKYELPGGGIDDKEQPDDAIRRHVRKDIGLVALKIQLLDVVSIDNREDINVQYIFVVYTVSGITTESSPRLSRSYDSYFWKTMTETQQIELRKSASELLGMYSKGVLVGDSQQNDTYIDVTGTADSNSARAIVYSDGGSRGNPGPSAAAYVILNDAQKTIEHGGTYLGITTSNQAEYQAVHLGLERALEMGFKEVEFRIDSMLVVNQLKGIYQIKNRELWPINERIQVLTKEFTKVKFNHVPRELNKMADSLVNKLLDEHQNYPA
jgi:ribonuclease HI